jgi:hypothetical protein
MKPKKPPPQKHTRKFAAEPPTHDESLLAKNDRLEAALDLACRIIAKQKELMETL